MTDYIKVLLLNNSIVEDRIVAADCIINNYDLPLSRDEILKVFEKSRKDIYLYSAVIYDTYERYEFLFITLLNSNTNMFIALAKNWCSYDYGYFMTIFVSATKPFKIGYYTSIFDPFEMYKKLLNFGDFNIDNLILPEECKIQIQAYRDEKYGGKLTKVVTNN